MADVEPVDLPPPAPQEEEVLSEGSRPVDEAQPEMQTTDGEHEVANVAEAPSEPEPADSVEEEKHTENGVDDGRNGVEEEPASSTAAPAEDAPSAEVKQPTPAASPPTTPSKKITAKSSINVKPPGGKAASGPPTPLVKKVR